MSVIRQVANIPAVSSSTNNIAIGSLPMATNNIPLNGTMVSSFTGQVSFIDRGYASGISISTPPGVNMTGVTFTVAGTFNGNLITENILGSYSSSVIATVYTNNLFHTITSISATGVGPGAFTIGSNYNVAVMLIGDNPVAAKLPKSNLYNVLLNSRAAGAVWGINTAMIYGVANTPPSLLQASALVNITSYNNYYALFGTANPTTVLQLTYGVITTTTYPFAAIVVYLPAGINTTPVFIEITQS